MRRQVTLGAVLIGACLLGIVALPHLKTQAQEPATPQACTAEEAVVTSVKKDLAALVDTVKKESEADFESKYHLQTCESRLSICLDMTNSALDCLSKAGKSAQDADTAYTQLKNTLTQDLQTLKNAKTPKDAKAAIETFDFTH
ncbi:MAG TPA: hypothetical protein VGX94_10630 [Terriglobia bacterium]|nr:hypothetical protein [Terriglobia bacterium]